jgi:nicotinate-nucleotide adenylyltransferase
VKVGVFGGSFDPIHRGHVAPVESARRSLGLDRVLFVPTALPPHKREGERAPVAPALARYAMVELALLDRPELEVTTLELTPDLPSYTIETLERLAAERPADEIWLLVGADALAGLGGWRRGAELIERFPLGVLARPGFDLGRAALGRRGGSVRIVPAGNEPVDLSSTEIRARLARGEVLPDGWLEPRVLTFLTKYRLYR